MNINRALPVVAAAVSFAIPTATKGQAVSGDILATATVAAVLSVSNANNLQFGTVFQNIAATVATDDIEAGQFAVTGANDAEITIDLTFPAVLDHTTIPATTMPFGTPTAEFSFTTAALGTPFVGGATATQTTVLSGIGELNIFVGGTVSPAVTQAPGDYEGTITATVDYTGN